MKVKLKVGLGLFQCIAAIPSVYGVRPSAGDEHLFGLLDFLELPNLLGLELVLPSTCISSYGDRLFMDSLWPLLLVLLIATSQFLVEIVVRWTTLRRTRFHHRRCLDAFIKALQRTLPFVLAIAFIFAPPVSIRIFKTLLCDTFAYDDTLGTERSYLQGDLSVSCSSQEYQDIKLNTLFLMIAWPLGVPVLFAFLLWTNRTAIKTLTPTPMTGATRMLWRDYEEEYFFWEPLDIIRRIVLCGGVLLIPQHAEQARVVVALCLSILFLALQLVAKPYTYIEDDVMVALVHLALTLLYLDVLVFKVCQDSPDSCQTFGFSNEKGLYRFYIFFSTGLLSLMVIFCLTRVYLSIWFQVFVDVASTHAVSPSLVLSRVVSRRVDEAWRRLSGHFLSNARPFQSIRVSIAVILWRIRRGKSFDPKAHSSMSPGIQSLAVGTTAEVYVEGLFQRSTCFVQLDAPVLVLRWTRKHWMSLLTVEDGLLQRGSDQSHSSLLDAERTAGEKEALGVSQPNREYTRPGRRTLRMDFRDIKGHARCLELVLPLESTADRWFNGITTLLSEAKASSPLAKASPTHGAALWLWCLQCVESSKKHMEVVGFRAPPGYIRRTKLSALLDRANTSVDHQAVRETLSSPSCSKYLSAMRASSTSQLANVRESKAFLSRARRSSALAFLSRGASSDSLTSQAARAARLAGADVSSAAAFHHSAFDRSAFQSLRRSWADGHCLVARFHASRAAAAASWRR